MPLKQRLLQKQVQRMIMTVKMQQSMHILQLPILELNQLISEEMDNNPVLEELSIQENQQTLEKTSPQAEEISEPEAQISEQESNLANKEQILDMDLDWREDNNIWAKDFFDTSKVSQEMERYDFQQNTITKSSTLQDELWQQLRIINNDPNNETIAEQIIGNIDENGYLTVGVEEIAQTLNIQPQQVEKVLELIQNLEPAGVGARNLKDCLLIQLRRQGKANSPEAKIVENFLTEIARRKFAQISKELKIPLSHIKKYVKNISRLDPKPGRNFSPGALRIIPDIILEKSQDNYEVIVNTKDLPQLTLSQMYLKLVKDKSCPEETLKFIKEKIGSAQNLISGLSQRQQTLEKVAKYVIDYQRGFLEKGLENIRPLTLKKVAAELNLHPSTISRTVANKYIQSPYGTFPLKNLFSQAITTGNGELSNKKIKMAIDEIIKAEQNHNPLSDQQIVEQLAQKGMHISRRTVAKYRQAIKIPPAYLRRK